jgi:hypothetical protein
MNVFAHRPLCDVYSQKNTLAHFRRGDTTVSPRHLFVLSVAPPCFLRPRAPAACGAWARCARARGCGGELGAARLPTRSIKGRARPQPGHRQVRRRHYAAACRRCQTTCCCLLPHRHLHLVRRCSWFILRHLLRLSLRPHRHHRHLLRHSTATLLPLSPSPSSAWSVATTTLRFAHGHWLTSLSPTPPASARASLRARRPALLCVRVRVYGTRDVRMHCIAGRAYWCLSRARAR